MMLASRLYLPLPLTSVCLVIVRPCGSSRNVPSLASVSDNPAAHIADWQARRIRRLKWA
jgi:hypothetical protein